MITRATSHQHPIRSFCATLTSLQLQTSLAEAWVVGGLLGQKPVPLLAGSDNQAFVQALHGLTTSMLFTAGKGS